MLGTGSKLSQQRFTRHGYRDGLIRLEILKRKFSSLINSYPNALLLTAIAVWLGITLALRPLAVPDEGRYADIGRWMLLSGDWLVPRLNGIPFFHKPPLFFWLEGGLMAVLGPHVWVARLVSAGAAWLTCLAVWFLASRWHSAATGRWAALILASNPMFFVGAQYINLDMLVCAWISCAVVCFAVAKDPDGRVHKRWLVLAYLALALGFLSKGLIGLVLPLLVLGAWMCSQALMAPTSGMSFLKTFWLQLWSQLWWQLRSYFYWPAIVVFLMMVMPWFALLEWHYRGFLNYFFIYQQFQRYVGAGFNNVQPLWFYWVAIPLLTLPWSGAACLQLLRTLYRHAKARRERGHLALLTLRLNAYQGRYMLWAIVILFFFSVPRSKLLGYVLPVLPPLVLWFSSYIGYLSLRWRYAILAFSLAFCLALVALPYMLQHKVFDNTLDAKLLTVLKAKLDKRSLASFVPIIQAAGPDYQLVFVGEYGYDLPYLLDSPKSSWIIDQWDKPDIRRGDNWRVELLDGAGMQPSSAEKVLLSPAQIQHIACLPGQKWWLVHTKAIGWHELFKAWVPVAQTETTFLFHSVAGKSPSTTQYECTQSYPQEHQQ